MPNLPETVPRTLTDLNACLAFSKHCLSSYRQRCQPHLTLGASRRELRQRILREGIFTANRPAWLAETAALQKRSAGWLLLGNSVALPLRANDARANGRLLALTALTSDWQRPQHAPARAQAWVRRRADADLLESLIVLSPMAIKRYCQHQQIQVSGHADLVQEALAGSLRTTAPVWAQQLRKRDQSSVYLDCERFVMPLSLVGAEKNARLLAVNCLWRDWPPTARQRGIKLR